MTIGLVAALGFGVGCEKTTGSETKELVKNSGKLYLQRNIGGLRGGEVTYTIYENGRIDFMGNVVFVLPGTSVEIDRPFNRTYHAQRSSIFSATYRNPINNLQVERMTLNVESVGVETRHAFASAVLSKNTHWTDSLYGAERIHFGIDTSSDIIRIDSVTIVNGWTYWDKVTNTNGSRGHYGDAEYSSDSQEYKLNGIDTTPIVLKSTKI